MKKDKKLIAGIVLALFGILFIIVSVSPFDWFGFLLGFVCIAVGALLLYLKFKKSNDKKSETPKVIKIVYDGTRDIDLLPEEFEDYKLKYSYERDICFIDKANFDKVVGHAGEQLTFEFEEDNPYDEKAVKILLNDEHIGYVYKGQTQDMIHDWVRKDWELAAHVDRYFPDEKRATYKIGFYVPMN